jgi:hypothetical protein
MGLVDVVWAYPTAAWVAAFVVALSGWMSFFYALAALDTPSKKVGGLGRRSRMACNEYRERLTVHHLSRQWGERCDFYDPPGATPKDDCTRLSTYYTRCPLGRTGLQGLGVFPLPGSNLCIVPIVVRFEDNRPYLLMCQGQLPGWRVFCSAPAPQVLTHISSNFDAPSVVEEAWKDSTASLHGGVVDSCLNTDHSWLEVSAPLLLIDDDVQPETHFRGGYAWVSLLRMYVNAQDPAQGNECDDGHAHLLYSIITDLARMFERGEFEVHEEVRDDIASSFSSDKSDGHSESDSTHSSVSGTSDTEPEPAAVAASCEGHHLCTGPARLCCSRSGGGADAAECGCTGRSSPRDAAAPDAGAVCGV